jgi:hypothetical protein
MVGSPSSFSSGRTRATNWLMEKTVTTEAHRRSRRSWPAVTREGEKYNLLHEGFSKPGATLTVVLVCFGQEVDTYIYRDENSPHLH